MKWSIPLGVGSFSRWVPHGRLPSVERKTKRLYLTCSRTRTLPRAAGPFGLVAEIRHGRWCRPCRRNREWWRCEVPVRCCAIDPETGRRTELLWSDTARVEFAVSGARACRFAHCFARGVEYREGSPYFEQLEINRECSCTLLE